MEKFCTDLMLRRERVINRLEQVAIKQIAAFMRANPKAEKYREVMAMLLDELPPLKDGHELAIAYNLARQLHKLPPYNGKAK